MSLPRAIAPVLLAALVLAVPPGVADTHDGGWRVLSPVAGDMLVGRVEFRFEVDADGPPLSRIDVYVGGRLVGSARPPEWTFAWPVPAAVSAERCLAIAYAGDDVVDKRAIDTRALAAGETVQVRWVQLYPVVVDRRGRYVEGLDAGDFEVLDEGERVDSFRFATSTASSTVAVLLDSSESMTDRLVIMQEAADRFVRDLAAHEHGIAVYGFNHALTRLATADAALEVVRRQIRGLRAGGGTALYDSMAAVIRDLGAIDGRRALVVFTDGRDELSIATLSMVEREAQRTAMLVYVIGTKDADEDPAQRQARRDLQRLAEESGGVATFIGSVSDLGDCFDRILADLEAQYVIAYPVPAGATGLRRIEVRTTDRSRRVRVRSAYRVD